MKSLQFSSKRMCVYARRGMVTTGNALASSAGIRMLEKGGNAVDAAIACAAVLCVVEPTANGLGSDNFALIWNKDRLYGMNSSGRSPALFSKEAVQAKHGKDTETMPVSGWTPVTVPGAVAGWVSMHEKFGSLPFEQVLEPAISYAENGFPIGQETARMWNKGYEKAKKNWKGSEYDGYFETFGCTVKPGQIIAEKSIAQALRDIAGTRGKSLYEGRLAARIDEESRKHGGFVRKEDLAAHKVQWVDPVSIGYKGYEVWEIPPNGQGITALMALNTIKHFPYDKHVHIEAIKQAFANAKAYITDPDWMKTDYHALLSESFGAHCASRIDLNQAKEHGPSDPACSGMVYLCAADQYGNMVSMIQSNYMGFGSGIMVDGVSLQNRGADFSLSEEDINFAGPNKRTYHTIIPGFITKDGKAFAAFGVMGGYMQPQGHVQVVTNVIDRHMDIQSALDAPRWMWDRNNVVHVEPGMEEETVAWLRAKGHTVVIENEYSLFGRGQIIVRMENGVYCGACEPRTDSNIACC